MIEEGSYPHAQMAFDLLTRSHPAAVPLLDHISKEAYRQGFERFKSTNPRWAETIKEILCKAEVNLSSFVQIFTPDEVNSIFRPFSFKPAKEIASVLEKLPACPFAKDLLNHFYSFAGDPLFARSWFVLAEHIYQTEHFSHFLTSYPEDKLPHLVPYIRENINVFCQFVSNLNKCSSPAEHQFIILMSILINFDEGLLLNWIYKVLNEYPDTFLHLLLCAKIDYVKTAVQDVNQCSFLLRSDPTHSKHLIPYLSEDMLEVLLAQRFASFGFPNEVTKERLPKLSQVVSYLDCYYKMTASIDVDQERVVRGIPLFLMPYLLTPKLREAFKPFLSRITDKQINALSAFIEFNNCCTLMPWLREHLLVDQMARLIQAIDTPSIGPYLEGEEKKRFDWIAKIVERLKEPSPASLNQTEAELFQFERNPIEKAITAKLRVWMGDQKLDEFVKAITEIQKLCLDLRKSLRKDPATIYPPSPLLTQEDKLIGLYHLGDLEIIGISGAKSQELQEFLLHTYKQQPNLHEAWVIFKSHGISSLKGLFDLTLVERLKVFNLHEIALKMPKRGS